MITSASNKLLEAISVEHKQLSLCTARILEAILAGRDAMPLAAALLDDLVEMTAEHFAHEEEDGYFATAIEVAPWRFGEVDQLKRQHADLLNGVMRLSTEARQAAGSRELCDALESNFRRFLRNCAAHEAAENRLMQEIYSRDIAATD